MLTILYCVAVKLLTSNNTTLNGEKFDGRVFFLGCCLLFDAISIAFILSKLL